MGAFPKKRYEFGEWSLDPDEHLLLRQGNPVPLTPKVFQTLLVLVENAGSLVAKDEFMKRVWPDSFVEEAALSQNISLLRKILAKAPTNGASIETVSKRGYRLLTTVRTLVRGLEEVTGNSFVSPSQAASDQPILENQTARAGSGPDLGRTGAEPVHNARVHEWARLVAYAGILLVVLGLSVLYSRVRSRGVRAAEPIQVRSIAVLPLENLSNNREDDYFADGMTDQLITDLGQIKALRVISRTSVMQYKGARKPIAQIGRELNVDAVVEGTILKSGSQVRITAQLIQAPLDKHLWAKSYEGDLHDVLSLQNNVAAAIAQEIQVTLTPREQALLKAGHPVNPEAYEDYLQGRYFWNKRDGGAMEKAIEYFQKATSIDPNYAPAYAGLAQTYALIGGNEGPKDEFFAAGKRAANQALALDPNLAEAHTALALLLGGEYNFIDEEHEFKLAVSLDPNYATGHQWYGEVYLVQMKRFEEANREMQQALALDPASRIIATDWGVVLYWERRYDDAYMQLSKVIAMDAGFSEAYLWRGRVLLQQGKYPEAIADLETAHRINHASQTISPTLAYAYGLSGDRAKANAQLRILLAKSHERYVSPWAIGLVYLGLGDNRHSIDWFEKAVRDRLPDMTAASVAPEIDPLRNEPRFKALMAAMKLPN